MNIRKKYVLAAVILLVILSAAFVSALIIDQSGGFHPFNRIQVACVGDSITEGTYYPSDLQILLGHNYEVGNFGASGRTVLENADKPYINSQAFQNAIAFEPKIVIIMLGTNDANPKYYSQSENFTSDYKTLIAQFEVSNPKIWIVIPPPIFNSSIGPSNENLVQGIIPRIQQIASDLNLPTIDVNSALLNKPQDFWDGLHPDEIGAEIIAMTVYRAIVNPA